MGIDSVRVTALRAEVHRRMGTAADPELPFWTDLHAAMHNLQELRSQGDPLALAERKLGRRFDVEVA